jgi:hypothetical protein
LETALVVEMLALEASSVAERLVVVIQREHWKVSVGMRDLVLEALAELAEKKEKQALLAKAAVVVEL